LQEGHNVFSKKWNREVGRSPLAFFVNHIHPVRSALLDYIDQEPHGFQVLVRESPALSPGGTFSSVMNDVAHQVEHILAAEFTSRRLDPRFAELYSQALVGMVALVGQWWREARKPKKETVAAHLVNLAWNGLSHLEAKPALLTHPR